MSNLIVPPELLDTRGRVVYFPVRHHSPACARLVREFVTERKPAAVLIEGPSDFNERLDELALPHTLPIAIYSYVLLADGSRRGAFYPFCEYSPEWQALEAAREVGSVARFIDLPWAELASSREEAANRYSDAELRYGRYVAAICKQLGVENFDAAWDLMIEQHGNLTLEDYFSRCHHYCCQVRAMEERVPESDERREVFMAEQIRAAMEEFAGMILVVTGGFHSSALLHHQERAQERAVGLAPTELDSAGINPAAHASYTQRGIAITPYSYERLDSLRGYEAGMPSPGFYHQVWSDRRRGQKVSHHPILIKVVKELRKRGQTCSTADVVALETMAQGLAMLRGREEVWREDLVDAITSALVKEEIDDRRRSPFLDAVYHVFRGDLRGLLAEGAVLPPLVVDIKEQLHRLDLDPRSAPREVELDLTKADDLEKSRLLHRLKLLEIGGFARERGTDVTSRRDLSHWYEVWSLRWHPEFEAACIEAARYGVSLTDATNAKLLERAQALERDAESASLILLDAALAGLKLPPQLVTALAQLIATENQFLRVVAALGHLFYLYRYDEVFGTSGSATLGQLLSDSFTRAVWLLEQLGQTSGLEAKTLQGIRALAETFEHVARVLDLNREEFVAVLARVQADRNQLAAVRGAAAGALVNLGVIDPAQIRAAMLEFANPAHLGDFLTGLFCVAREMAQRDPQLVRSIDELLLSLGPEEFLAALPSFRLAFTFFTPREKHHLLNTLFKALGIIESQPLAALEVDDATAAQALALEARVFGIVERFGLRGAETT